MELLVPVRNLCGPKQPFDLALLLLHTFAFTFDGQRNLGHINLDVVLHQARQICTDNHRAGAFRHLDIRRTAAVRARSPIHGTRTYGQGAKARRLRGGEMTIKQVLCPVDFSDTCCVDSTSLCIGSSHASKTPVAWNLKVTEWERAPWSVERHRREGLPSAIPARRAPAE